MAEIIKLNKWSHKDRYKLAESLTSKLSDITRALGFYMTTISNESGKRSGLRTSPDKFEVSIIIDHAFYLRNELSNVLKQLGAE